ncbi:hypothetical protein FKM82_009648 [Ascaphus truei]
MSNPVPVDMINLRLILVSGKTKEFLFSPNDSAADIAKHVYDNWPMDWEEEQSAVQNPSTHLSRTVSPWQCDFRSIKTSSWQDNSDAFGC